MARCAGKTVAGKRCKHSSSGSSKFCGHHKGKKTSGKSKRSKKVSKPKSKRASKKAPKKSTKKRKTRKVGASRRTPRYAGGKKINAPYFWFLGSTDKGNLSNKYWAGKTEGSDVVIHHGGVGTSGRIARTPTSSPAAAKKELAKRQRSKTLKGYMRVNPKRNPCQRPRRNSLFDDPSEPRLNPRRIIRNPWGEDRHWRNP